VVASSNLVAPTIKAASQMMRPSLFMAGTYQVYIIQSQKHGRFYVGMSSDPEKRLHFHNLGLNTSTRNGVPWENVWRSDPLEKPLASALESKIKKRGAGRFLQDINHL